MVDALRSSYEPEVLKHAKCWVFDDAVWSLTRFGGRFLCGS